MRSDWQAVKLCEVVTLMVGFPFKSSLYTDAENGVALLRGDNVVQGRLRWDGVKRWPRQSVSEVSAYMLERGDVVLAMDRPWIEAGLKYACIEHHDLPCLLVQRVARLRAAERMHQGFLRYVIGSKAFTEHILSVQTGTTVPHISGEQIKSFEFLLPPIKQQLAIASILSTLDDKIELNRRMNETLESIARAVFQSWFIDFDPVRARMEGRQQYGMDAETMALFPRTFAETRTGVAPCQWQEGILAEAVVVDRNAVNPAIFAEEIFDHYSIPAFDDGRFPVREAGVDIKSNKFLVPADAVLVSKLNPRIPRVWMPLLSSQRRSICSTEYIVVSPKTKVSREYLYCFFSSQPFREEFAMKVTGTSGSHQRVRPDDLLTTPIVIPSSGVMAAFTDITRPMYSQQATNLEQSHTLSASRDVLLPKLISGEVRVRDAEKVVEANL